MRFSLATCRLTTSAGGGISAVFSAEHIRVLSVVARPGGNEEIISRHMPTSSEKTGNSKSGGETTSVTNSLFFFFFFFFFFRLKELRQELKLSQPRNSRALHILGKGMKGKGKEERSTTDETGGGGKQSLPASVSLQHLNSQTRGRRR